MDPDRNEREKNNLIISSLCRIRPRFRAPNIFLVGSFYTKKPKLTHLDLTELFYTDCLYKPRAAKMLCYGCTCQTTKSFFSLEIYGVVYKCLTTNITTCPDYPRCNFNCEQVKQLQLYSLMCPRKLCSAVKLINYLNGINFRED